MADPPRPPPINSHPHRYRHFRVPNSLLPNLPELILFFFFFFFCPDLMEKAVERQRVLLQHLRPDAASPVSAVSPSVCAAGDSAAYQRSSSFNDDVVIVAFPFWEQVGW